MRILTEINFYLTKPIYDELMQDHRWAMRVRNLHRKPYLKMSLSLLYFKDYVSVSYSKYTVTSPSPNGLDPLLTEDQVMLLIQSSKLIGLPELTYLAAALHQENKQNKL